MMGQQMRGASLDARKTHSFGEFDQCLRPARRGCGWDPPRLRCEKPSGRIVFEDAVLQVY